MELIERNHCVISGETDLEFLHSFEKFPVFMGCVTHPPEEDIRADMNWWISRKTGSVQLNPLIPLDVLYYNEHGAGLVGCTMSRHHIDFAKFMRNKSPQNIIEIGGGHGLLAENYLKLNKNATWTIMEPNPSREYPKGINCIRSFFEEKVLNEIPYDAVVHSHVFEHMYEPDQFIEKIAKNMDSGKLMYFAVPQIVRWLENGYFNAINFEHTVLLASSYIEYLLRKYNFVVLNREKFMGEHSVFYECQKVDKAEQIPLPNKYDKHKKVFNRFVENTLGFVSDVNGRMDRSAGKTFVFGGHIFAQFLFRCGLKEDAIECILDNNQEKQEKRLYGTNLIVKSPNILKDIQDAHVILKAGPYNEEIKEDILNNINPSVTFWE